MNANDTQVGGNHYKGKRFQPWDWDKYGIGTYEMDILHYITRQKNGVEDLKKAVHYFDKLMEEYDLHDRRNRIPYPCREPIVLTAVKSYCDEWNMNTFQRHIVHALIEWEDRDHLYQAKRTLTNWIADAYPIADVRSSGGVESPESH